MQIAIISDTHLKKDHGELTRLSEMISGVDLLVHGGDYGGYWVLEYLQTKFKFTGVWGNCDDALIRSCLTETKIITIDGVVIGIYHGHGTGKTTMDRALNAFANQTVDIIVYGHSHQPVITTKNGILLLNPGSPTTKRKERWFSYIILTINAPNINASLHFLPMI